MVSKASSCFWGFPAQQAACTMTGTSGRRAFDCSVLCIFTKRLYVHHTGNRKGRQYCFL